MTYASHRHRNAALPYWLFHYNERRPHSSLGDRPPISRVHNVCRQDTSLVVSDAHAGPKTRSPRCSAAHGSAAACTSCGRRLAMCAKTSRAWSLRCCDRSSTPKTICANTRAYRRRARAPPAAATEGRRAARRRRGRPARLLRLPWRSLDEAALHKSAGTGEPRNRATHRRRRDLPQRPLPDPARSQRRHRTER